MSVHGPARPAASQPAATSAKRSSRTVKYEAPMSTTCRPPSAGPRCGRPSGRRPGAPVEDPDGVPGVGEHPGAGDAGDAAADHDDGQAGVGHRTILRRRASRREPDPAQRANAALPGIRPARGSAPQGRSPRGSAAPLVLGLLADRAGGAGERGERAQEPLVRLVRPRHRALAAPAGAAQCVEPAVVAGPGVGVALDGRAGLERPLGEHRPRQARGRVRGGDLGRVGAGRERPRGAGRRRGGWAGCRGGSR